MRSSIIIAKRFFFILIMVMVFSCTEKEEKSSAQTLFESIPSTHSKITFKNNIYEDEFMNAFVYEYFYNGAGVAVGDINNDGLDDIYFTSNFEANQLYLNKGELQFQNITKTSYTEGGQGWTTGTNMIDINNDGLLDIYVCKSGPFRKSKIVENELYINKGVNKQGIPVFKEEAAKYGLNDASYSIQSVFFDFDLDGDLDMYLMNHNPQTLKPGSLAEGRLKFSDLGDKFYVNENGKYINKTKEVGIYSNAIAYGLGIGISDLNSDGWPDMYISNDYEEHDYMYINQKDGTFKDVVKKATKHISNFSMGNDLADFDNDGFTDIITLDMVSEDNYGMKTGMPGMNPEKFNKNIKAGRHYQYMYNAFQKHTSHIDANGTPFYSDVGQISGISNTDWSWAPLLADFNNDGLKDVFITNGIKRDFRNKDFFERMKVFSQTNKDAFTNPQKLKYLISKMPNKAYKNYFYQNSGNLKFQNTSDTWLENASKSCSNGAAYADLDNDGDLDLIVNNVDQEATILRNNSERISNNKYIKLEFKGLKQNSNGIGARAVLYTDNGKQVYENYTVRGYLSSVPPKLNIGIAENAKVDSLYVFGPNGEKQKVRVKELNRSYTIQFNSPTLSNTPPPLITNAENTLFTLNEAFLNFEHVENEFDDYQHQLLLPHKLSQFGPAVAIGDINGDGVDDIYLGQSTGEAGSLYIQNRSGTFIKKQTFVQDAIFEDVDAKFLDFDKDGDLDLYVASGGNEFEENSKNYADRIYENRSGTFVKRTDLLPKSNTMSSSKISVNDFNKDGYPDVFVGGRHLPRQYPSPTSSYILMNQKGTFLDITKESAPELQQIGMVTNATWTDYDNDNDDDLLIVGEWMAPTLFENENNTFKKADFEYLNTISGWYYTVKAVDLDQDGDDDYILGNLGENYKYKASKEEPFEVYFHDFDSNGEKDIVLGYYNFGELFPVRGKECSSQQIPGIKKIAPTYHDFGNATITDIYGEENLKNALKLSSYNFKNGILKNNGNGNFDFVPLPEIAQISSINDILIKDLNRDGKQDIIIAGNLFTSEIETPRNDAGYGMVLLNQGQFNFKPINAAESGLFLPYDVKNLHWMNINDKTVLVSGNNNDKLAAFIVNR